MTVPRCLGWRVVGVAARLIARWPQRVALATGALFALLLRPLLGGRRRVAAINLSLCFPSETAAFRRRLLRAHLRSLGVALVELLRAFAAPRRALEGLADVEGLQHLREAETRGQGVLLLTGHLMHSELAARFLVEAGSGPIASVVRRYDRHPCLERQIDAGRRSRLGPTIGKFDTRAMVRALRDGQRLAYLADQDFRANQVFVPFFGVPAATLAGIPQLVKAGRACVRFFDMARDADGRYRVRVIDPGLDALLDDPQAFAARYMQVLEAAVRRAPDQYLWIHRRFKTRPAGEASPYA
jgi:KDO2-lipid IV(A) lauroyltransferase